LLYLTHDIDWLSPFHPYAWIKCLTHGSKWLKPQQLMHPTIFLDSIESVCKQNAQENINPVWLIGAASAHTLNRYGIRYTIHSANYPLLIQLLKRWGCAIGLQGIVEEKLNTQVIQLKSFTGQNVLYHRLHFLKQYNELENDLAQANIKVDFSFGKARQVHWAESDSNTEVKFVPTLLFDNAFFFNNPEEVFSTFSTELRKAIATNKDVAICFHPENFLILPALREYYQEVIRISRNEGAVFHNPASTL
jgi:hypothetical protein